MTTKYNVEDHRSGDTWPGLNVTVRDDDGAVVDLTSAQSIIMQVKGNKNDDSDDAIFTADLDDGITVTDASGGTFTVDASIITGEQADYYYDIEVILQSGAVYTVVSGTFPVRQDTSR